MPSTAERSRGTERLNIVQGDGTVAPWSTQVPSGGRRCCPPPRLAPQPLLAPHSLATPKHRDRRFRESPVLPFNAFGTMAIAREEFDSNSGSSQFFWLLKACVLLVVAARRGAALCCAGTACT